ncbi:hypothetical protein Y032_0105g3709 [Ancylostoma ceylanicum]|uniref:Potassium channel domain-containing protein n=1 Tax=Ancylostoma ceylanicum TaxID=53326 RepID=A0A016TGE2_9BILA|nr:hypothetical protein Y032_0105g3709 [Ancylostoma ceylanicum]
MVRIRKAALDTTIRSIAEEMTQTVNDPNKTVDVETMVEYLQLTYITLLKQESAYKDSTFYKAEDGKNLKWTFGSSFFFSMNVFTTTGYGSIAPESTLGKTCVIIYGFIFVPLTLVVIRHLGNWTLLIVTNIYAKCVIRWRKFRSKTAVQDGEIFTLPVILCMLIMFVYLMGTTTFIFVYDTLSGPKSTGIDYFNSFYFSFISISTIGLGDVMPNNVTFDPVITILFFFGMPLMKVVNSSTYQSVEKATIGILTLMENRLSTVGQRPKVADVSVGVTAGSFALAQGLVPNIDVFQQPKGRAITLTDLNTGPQLQEDDSNNITVRSVLTFIKSDAHVYGGRFGRVDLEAKMSPR